MLLSQPHIEAGMQLQGLDTAHSGAHHLPRCALADDAGGIEAGHLNDIGQGGGCRAGRATATTVGLVSQEVGTGTATAAHAADAI
jgi:hypothetical protein